MTQSRNPGTNLSTSAANYSIFFDSTGFYCRNNYMGNPFIEFSSGGASKSLHAVFNAAASKLITGLETNYGGSGGLIELQSPIGNIMPTRAPLEMQSQITLRGGGASTIIQVQGPAGNWTGGSAGAGNSGIHAGTFSDPSAVIDAYGHNKVRVEEVMIDCNSYAGTTGLLFVKGSGQSGGNNAHSYFLYNEVRNFALSGTQLGVQGVSGATSTSWWIGNQVVDPSSNSSKGMAFYNGDAHVGAGTNVKGVWTTGFPVWINSGSIHWTGPIHVVNNGSSSNAMITVASGGNCSFSRIYMDNLDDNMAAFEIATTGACNRMMIWNNWIHNTLHSDGSSLNGANATPSNSYLFKIGNGGAYDVNISNNTCEWSDGGQAGGPSSHRLAALLKITNASGKHAENSLTFIGNTAQGCENFTEVDGNIDTAPGVGTASNIIDDSDSGGTSIRIGPGATPTTLEYPIASFVFSGTLTAGNGQFRVYIDGAWTITKVRASVGTAPVAQPIRIDIDKNSPSPYGTGSIFSSTGNQPTIAAGGFTNQKTAFSTSSLSNADYLTCDIDLSGAESGGTAGANLTVQVFGTPA